MERIQKRRWVMGALGWDTWAVEEKSSAAYIGSVGYGDKKRPPEHPASGSPEMGWLLGSSMQGKGYASEAIKAALQWGRKYFGAAHVVCVIGDDNAPSIRVAEKHGFQQLPQQRDTVLAAKSSSGNYERRLTRSVAAHIGANVSHIA